MDRYEVLERCLQTPLMLICGEEIQSNIEKIGKIQAEIVALRKGKKESITDEMIQTAKEYPYGDLIPLKRGVAVCPFHPDKDPSFSVKNNYGRCFGCGWKGDTISFVMAKDGISFAEAVRRLQ